jgi:hypothetical protein
MLGEFRIERIYMLIFMTVVFLHKDKNSFRIPSMDWWYASP